MLLGTLSAIVLGNILANEGINRAARGRGINRACKGFVRAGFVNKCNKIDFNTASFFY